MKNKGKYYLVKSNESNWNLCPVCDSELTSCHIGSYCSNKNCEGSYVDGLCYFTAKQAKKYKDIILK